MAQGIIVKSRSKYWTLDEDRLLDRWSQRGKSPEEMVALLNDEGFTERESQVVDRLKAKGLMKGVPSFWTKAEDNILLAVGEELMM